MSKDSDKSKQEHWRTALPETWTRLAPESRRMRVAPTPAEHRLWRRLRRKALGVRFRRQHVVAQFVVDFCALEAQLIVEVDGPMHQGQGARDAILVGAGFRVLRFRNEEVDNRLDRVLGTIQAALRDAAPPTGQQQ